MFLLMRDLKDITVDLILPINQSNCYWLFRFLFWFSFLQFIYQVLIKDLIVVQKFEPISQVKENGLTNQCTFDLQYLIITLSHLLLFLKDFKVKIDWQYFLAFLKKEWLKSQDKPKITLNQLTAVSFNSQQHLHHEQPSI